MGKLFIYIFSINDTRDKVHTVLLTKCFKRFVTVDYRTEFITNLFVEHCKYMS